MSMSLKAGHKLGPFEVREPIGQGGMGAVYRARDTKLDREVAIKVLPEELSKDEERLARFEREAKLLAQLNHSNVATLHGFENGYLVMELVEGETLAERIARGPIPIDEAIPLFLQIAEGLEAAHEKGIIHRDLKPANIKITPEGKIKILDFGLARLAEAEVEAPESSSKSPTLTKGTALGAILGTAAYMSPEQARGKPVDKRTDVWAFGVCLYQSLTRRLPFRGETVTDVLAAVVREKVDWDILPHTTPALVRRLIQRCLEKDVSRRLRDIGDALADLRDAWQFEARAAGGTSSSPLRSAWFWAVPLILVLGFGIVFGLAGLDRVDRIAHPVRFTVELPELTSYHLHGASLALSPDGSLVAFPVGRGPTAQLYIHDFSRDRSEAVRGTDGGLIPFFSPDGEWLGFFADGALKKVPTSGGAPMALAESRQWYGASLGDEGSIVFAPSFFSPIWQVPADGSGQAREVSSLRPGELTHVWPQILPGERAVLFTVYAEELSIAVVSLGDGERHELVQNAAFARYVPTGHLLFVRGSTMMAVRFDPERLAVLGPAVPVVEDIALNRAEASSQYAISNDGTLVYGAADDVDPPLELVRVDRSGRVEAIGEARPQDEPHVSPDGRYVVLVGRDDERHLDIWTLDVERGARVRLTDDPVTQVSPVWAPGGHSIVFSTEPQDLSRGFDLGRISADRGGGPESLLTSRNDLHPSSITADGAVLAYTTGFADGSSTDVWTLRLDGSSEPEPLIATAANEGLAAFSPDGKWVAYQSDESGRFEIYAVPYPGRGARHPVSTNGGAEPVWAPKGDELFYRPLDENGVMAVDVDLDAGGDLSFGLPRRLFEGYYPRHPWSTATSRNYDVMPDGEHFVALRRPSGESARMHVVLNWFTELERLVPAEN